MNKRETNGYAHDKNVRGPNWGLKAVTCGRPTGIVLTAIGILALGAVLPGCGSSDEENTAETAAQANAEDSTAPTQKQLAALPAAAAETIPPIDLSGQPELVQVRSNVSEEGVTVNASVEFGVWTNCGSYDEFLAKYKACEPAAIRMQTMGTFIVEYRVLGERDGVCQIEMTSVEMPPYPDWQGKSMTCPCDNTKDFIKLTEELGPGGILDGSLECEGPLFDAMNATLKQSQG